MSSLELMIETDKRERRAPPARTDTMDSLTRVQMRNAAPGGRSPRRRLKAKKKPELDQSLQDMNDSNVSESSSPKELACAQTVDSLDVADRAVKKPVRRAGRKPMHHPKEEESSNSEE